jgi:hypothetical protein
MNKMTASTSKIRLKIGTMELEYEGDPSFLNGGIERLLETMGALSSNFPDQTSELALAEPSGDLQLSENTVQNKSINAEFTTSTLAAHADAKTGPELILCAMAYLQLSKGERACTSPMILAEMKTASAYYKTTMSGNNASSLKALVKSKKINEVSNGKYSLASSERKRFEEIVGGLS